MKLEAESVVSRIIAGVVTIIFAVLMNWFFLPAWNFSSGGFWWYCILVGIFALISFAVSDYIAYEEFSFTKIIAIVLASIIFLGIILVIASSQIFKAVQYANLIEIKEGNFEENVQSISTVEEARDFPLMDVETAKKLGNRPLSKIEKAFQYSIDEISMITYRGQIYYLLQLDYVSKNVTMNEDNIPGYILVDVKTEESTFVKNEIKYAPSHIFSQDLKRHLRSKYPAYEFDEFQFDVDDDGEAYYIAPVLKSTIGLFGGKKVTSFVIVNAHTGECKEYLPEDLPKWTDHAYSLDYLMERTKEHYENQEKANNGFSPEIDISYSYRATNEDEIDESKKGKYFEGYNEIMTQDGTKFFTCLVSKRNDEIAFGFILANSRTGEITYYDCSGAAESTVQLQAESIYQNYDYKSSYPVMVNVDGVPTYVISLKDKSKNNKAYVMVNVENSTVSASGETLEDTLLNYKEKIVGEEATITPEDLKVETSEQSKNKTKATKGTITELYQVTQNGTTQFFFLLEGDDNLYISSIANNSRQVRMSVGSNVSIEYSVSKNEELVGIVSKIEIQ